ncbi:Tat (twin-arginine translocation) pathway signal sequence [Streptomyces sp. DvalAA-14]|uniref:twin-arginine translocation signal domain-containing protein n=1 Tax=unclassified Streptomyces TaxID=2593676 RepID=UPI00081B6796|nr:MULTISPECIES: twin-arginine translocation signal domain-containing protein [unclassified Streptomyces]MYS21813.1 twin-arginine translocation signal domain-containing protein [Streptomyces sp. SID4948]SCE01699.1 Tat (twin-arginine translocation) pathway signal sequence [Streptomyces sp. DvalAA-14]
MEALTRRNFIGGLALAGAAVAIPATAGPAQAAPKAASDVETWQLIGKDVFTGDAGSSRGQGVTTDGSHWYFSSSNGLEITDMKYNTVLKTSPAIPAELADPSQLSSKGLNHIGDLDYANGHLYIPLDSSASDPGSPHEYPYEYNTPVFALYNAGDLTFTGRATALDAHGVHDIASWVAVDAEKGLAYGMAYADATQIAVYSLSDFTFKKYISISQPINEAQGGKVHQGWMYFSCNDAEQTIARADLKTGEVQVLFNLTVPYPQEVEGLAFLETRDGLTLNILNREQPDPNAPGNVTFYHYLLQTPGKPVIKGTPEVGSFLTANPGKWTPAAKFSYQWLLDGTPLAHATGHRFDLLSKYLGDKVTVEVTGTWADGTSTTVESAPVKVRRGSGRTAG